MVVGLLDGAIQGAMPIAESARVFIGWLCEECPLRKADMGRRADVTPPNHGFCRIMA